MHLDFMLVTKDANGDTFCSIKEYTKIIGKTEICNFVIMSAQNIQSLCCTAAFLVQQVQQTCAKE